MNISMIIVMILIGIFTGIVTGLTGASGVIAVVPLVNMLLNFSIHESIGTSLIVDTIAPLAISYTYYKHGNIDIKSGIGSDGFHTPLRFWILKRTQTWLLTIFQLSCC